MEKLFRVQVVKAGKSSYWYSGKIGEEFIVRESKNSYGDYECGDNQRLLLCAEDIKVISEVEKQTVFVDVVRKVKKYLVVYKLQTGAGAEYRISNVHYESKESFDKVMNQGIGRRLDFVSLIEDSMIEE